MRRLPVYLLIDVSGSLTGEPIEAIKNGLHVLLSTLRQDPQALETAYLSVITYGREVRQVVPLTEISAINLPQIAADGITPMGAALGLLAERIEAEVEKTTPTSKGDWKPIVFIMTDGKPTDDWRAGLARFRTVKVGNVIACAAGADADTSVLREITESVISLETADKGTISAFFKWVSASISVSSQRIETGGGEGSSLKDLPPPPPEINTVF
ncbi:tellerium resistance protein TerY [alpha proteobacterium AAP38]|uniref:vWA domain-containing protein n=1 Tax=Niveispirillum sp. TaxID=1917217 RepID=UPI0006B8B95A|nr:tellerium resistance protein TerY [alpha proteobacterium AAP38]